MNIKNIINYTILLIVILSLIYLISVKWVNGHKSEIWKPKIGSTWYWQLDGPINTSRDADVYDIDLEKTPKSVIDELHKKGKKVICYINVGAWENFRADSNKFPKDVIGNQLNGWIDERWLDIKHFNKFKDIIEKRFDMAAKKGCDAIEPDNIDAYIHDTGFNISYEDQIVYNKWLANEAHKRNLSIGLKNDVDQVNELVNYFDFAINEECFKYNECEKLLPFIKNGKAVFHVEYDIEPNIFCKTTLAMGFSSIKSDKSLNGYVIQCKNQ